ncbi:M1 family metallopeptidase [Candidatus Saccharibacteria bacterium]|nr:M1 family metallopeptidase [Candidatus Saccharibacteria bacterium]
MERLIKYFVPEKYELRFQFYLDDKKFGGTEEIVGEAKSEVIKLHAVNLRVSSVEVNGIALKYEVRDGILTIFDVPIGKIKISVNYEGIINENMEGVYLSTYEYEGQTEKIIATQFESHYAREAFPCVDEPEAKATFVLKMEMSGKFDGIMLSNMPEEGGNGDIHVFEETPRMSTYLLAFVVGKFHGKTVTNAHGVEVTTYVALNQNVDSVDFANEIAAKSLEFYDDNFGVDYPLKKLTQVALPDFEAGAMENWGLVTYRESMMIASENATLGTKKSVALTVAHELSHQWFGDLVTMKWWDDLWLNESFASVMEYYAVDHIHPEYKIFEGFFTGDALAALRRDCLSGVQSVHQEVHNPEEIATLFDPAIVYSKGARLMLMTIRAMGWGEFCKGIKDYFETHAYKNTVGDDLWKALNRYAEFDVGEMMHGFIDKPGYPVIEFLEGDSGEISDEKMRKFTQRRFLIDGEMTESDWVIPEVMENMSGHYVLNLNGAEFDRRLEDYDELGLEEKLRLLIDRDLVAKTELAESGSLLPLVEKFKGERSAAVWNIVLSIVAGLKVFFDNGSAEEKAYKKFVKELVRPGINEVGLVTRDSDDENTIRLRAILLALDFYAESYVEGDVDDLRRLAELYSDDYGTIDAEIRSDVLDAKFHLEPEMFEKYLKGYKSTSDPEVKFDLLFAMTFAGTKEAGMRVLDLLNQPEVVKPQDQFHLFIYLFRNPVMKEATFEWLRGHWDYVRETAGDKSLENYPRYMASSIRTENEYSAWKEFFEPKADDPALARAIEVGKNEIEARLKLIREDRDGVIRALMEMA